MSLSQRLKTNGRFNPVIMLFYGLIIAAVGYIIIASRAAPVPPTVYLNPPSQAYGINTTFTVDVRENSGTTTVNGLTAVINYPATLVDYVSYSNTGSPFTIDAQSTVNATTGQITLSRGTGTTNTGCPAPQTTCQVTVANDQLVTTLTFKTKTTGGTAAMAFATGTYLLNATTNQDILGSLSATAGGSYVIDATAPTVSITAPTNGAVIAGGSTSTISVNATDNTSVSKVDILIDGVLKTTLTASPYNYSWNTTGLALGSHTIQAKGYDPFNNTTTTPLTTVTLTDQTPPTVSITAPLNGATVTGTTNVSANATDNVAVSKVEFYVDGVLKFTDTTLPSPFVFSWDSKTATDGSHSLTAKAYDTATPANVATSAAVNVTVDNADHTPPSQPGNLSASNPTTTSIKLTWTASTDNTGGTGVTGYRIQRNGTTITTTTAATLTYTDTGLTPGTSYAYSVSAVDGNSNFSTPATVNASTIPLVTGDITGPTGTPDGHVDIYDLNMLLTNYGTNNALCDINKTGTSNGIVDVFDLSTLLTNYGR